MEDYHLHAFRIGNMEYGQPDPDLGIRSDRAVKLKQFVSGEKFKFRCYEYDFGDFWNTCWKLKRSLPQSPACTIRASPDRASAPVRRKMWAASGATRISWKPSATPKNPEHDEMLVTGGNFDPEAFDPEDVNDQLAQIK